MPGIPSKDYETLKAFIASKTEVSVVASAFIEPTRQAVSPNASEEDIEISLGSAWKNLLDVAADVPHDDQEPLVELLRHVQKQDLSAESTLDARKFQIWGEQVKIFTDLPLFGAAVRDAWNRAPGSGDKNDFSPEQWANINAFMARITSLSASVPAFDFSLYAIWVLRPAFEETEPKPSDIDAAKMWFLYAEDIIEDLSRQERQFDGRMARPGGKYEYKGWVGFNPERLKIWQTAL